MNLNLIFHVFGCFVVVLLFLWQRLFSIMICFVVVWINFALNMGFYMNENTCTRVCS